LTHEVTQDRNEKTMMSIWQLKWSAMRCGAVICMVAVAALAGCKDKSDKAPASVTIVPAGDPSLVTVDHPDQFPRVAAAELDTVSTLNATGSVTPDIDKEVPVISLASGRVVDVHAKLGDTVRKGQYLMSVRSDDIAGAYAQYRMAVADEVLAKTQLERAQLLYDKGAYPKSQLEIAQDTEDKAKVAVQTAAEHLKLMGIDNPDSPQIDVVKVLAPISGVIVAQNVTPGSAAGNNLTGSPNAFTIADLSTAWVICDVYENDLSNVHMGDEATVHLNAYPDKELHGRVSDIGAVLDPTIRTAKVRIDVGNPGSIMRIGMFATSTFHGTKKLVETTVPATAVLHLHDRDWLYIADPKDNGKFRRVSVVAGDMKPNGQQVVTSGIQPGAEVVSNALALQQTVDNQ
jgi:cobalt-zinc-cadmium efflux system membrane fusion protein